MKLQTNPLCTITKIDTTRIFPYKPYKVYFKHHPMARKMGDTGSGTVVMCTYVDELSLSFTSLSRTFTDGLLHVDTVDLSVEDIDAYKIEVESMFTEESVLSYLKRVKEGISGWPEVLDEFDGDQLDTLSIPDDKEPEQEQEETDNDGLLDGGYFTVARVVKNDYDNPNPDLENIVYVSHALPILGNSLKSKSRVYVYAIEGHAGGMMAERIPIPAYRISSDEIFVTEALAERLNLKIGEKVRITYNIIGCDEETSDQINDDNDMKEITEEEESSWCKDEDINEAIELIGKHTIVYDRHKVNGKQYHIWQCMPSKIPSGLDADSCVETTNTWNEIKRHPEAWPLFAFGDTPEEAILNLAEKCKKLKEWSKL